MLLLGQRKLDGLEQPLPQLCVFQPECFVYSDEFRPRRSAAVFGLDGRTDLMGVVIDALAAAACFLGLLSDSAAETREARRGIGDPTTEDLWCAWGVSPFVYGLGSQPHT